MVKNCFFHLYIFILAMALLMLEWQQSRERSGKKEKCN